MRKRRPLTLLEIARKRLHDQRLTGPRWERVADVVGWLGAVQAQDYAGAKWALAQRMKRCTDDDVDQAFARGEILRTHVLRPTWHFVLPADIRWLLELSAPRVKAASAYYWKKVGLDERSFGRSNEALAAALAGGGHLTRAELGQVLAAAGIADAAGERLGHLLMRAELDAVICSGPRRGKQFTYALLDERAPKATRRTREKALAELAQRYFQSHGPATAQDFAWWSGLTVADARAGIEATSGLCEETVDGERYFALPPLRRPALKGWVLHLLPNYDEHVIAYKDHRATLEPALAAHLSTARGVVDKHLVALNGQVVGGWSRSFARSSAMIELDVPARLDRAQRTALDEALENYGRFLEMKVELSS